MTKDSPRKKPVRARQAVTGDSYSEAARRLGPAAATAKDTPPAQVPVPVAIMLARHLDAATLHIGRARRLAEEHDVAAFAEGDQLHGRPCGPLAEIANAAVSDLFGLVDWANRTVHASGAIPAVPQFLDQQTPDQRQAFEILYPGRHKWCASPGGVLPAPGERPGETTGQTVTHSLPGPVTDKRLSLRASGKNLVRAGDLAPGTPAGAIWEAAEDLESYACDWMERGGDSPADLAAALDGLYEVAERLHGAIGSVAAEVERRYAAQSLAGGDRDEIAVRNGQADEAAHTLGHRIDALRWAMTGAASTLPPATPRTVPPHVAGPMDGKTLAQVRAEFGAEVFLQRHTGKTPPTDDRRADALERILQWMHARGASVYDAPAHAKTDASARLNG